MGWSIKKIENKNFNRNPIKSSNIELRFYPIFKIAEPSLLINFQDKVRKRYPKYDHENVVGVVVNHRNPGSIEVKNQGKHKFSDSYGNELSISEEFLIISCQSHKTRREIIDSFVFALDTLQEIYGEITPTRLGMRYINIISREDVVRDLNEDVQWGDLISDKFIGNLSTLIDMDSMNFITEVFAPVDDEGALVLRYGLTTPEDSGSQTFRVDLDRFIDAHFELNSVSGKLELFASDIYSVFFQVVEDKFEQWMLAE
jgi:uncharacterized protein (TIGR04255 family)